LLTRYPICFMHGLKSIFHYKSYWYGVPEFLHAHGYETIELFSYWRGPNEKRLQGFADQMTQTLKKHQKIHILAHSLGTLNILQLLSWPQFENRIASVTLIAPPFNGSPFAHLGLPFKFLGSDFFASTNETLTAFAARNILKNVKIPEGVLIGSVFANPGPHPISPKLKIQYEFLTRYLKAKGLPYENDGLVPLESQRIAEKFGPVYFTFPGDHNQVLGAGPWPENEKTAHEMWLDHCIFLAEYDLKHAK
jgi:pimeloyl-ACP methyl ester carboxylesterase